MRGRSWACTLLTAVAVACSGDGGATLDGAAAGGTPPPEDAVLVEAGWPDVAAFVEEQADAGRPTVINLFASWCGPCERELPLLIDTATANPDVAFLGIDHLDLRAAAEETLATYPLPYPTVYDPVGAVAGGLGARGMPTTVFFDAAGELVERHTGELTEELLAGYLETIHPGD